MLHLVQRGDAIVAIVGLRFERRVVETEKEPREIVEDLRLVGRVLARAPSASRREFHLRGQRGQDVAKLLLVAQTGARRQCLARVFGQTLVHPEQVVSRPAGGRFGYSSTIGPGTAGIRSCT